MWCFKSALFAYVSFATIACGLSGIVDWPSNLPSIRNMDAEATQWIYIADEQGVPHLAILNKNAPRYYGNIEEDVQFRLYTRSNRDTYYRLYVNDTDNLKGSNFDASKHTKMIIHGFTSSASSSLVVKNKDTYLNIGDYNIIGVDWSVLCPGPNYGDACENAKHTGAHIAEFIEFLVTQGGAKLEDIHVIGHSLGAQVAGIAGGAITSGKVARITALDAAYPMYGNADDDGRLDPTDAVLVDAIHTAGGGLGFDTAIGHVDFYPNGGVRPQPGCDDDLLGTCSHAKSVTYFETTLEEPEVYPGRECLTLQEAETGECTGTASAVMGEYVTYEKPGMYYLDTTFHE